LKDSYLNLLKKYKLEKYADVIPYIFFGGCTTLVNIIVYWFLAHPLGMATIPATIVAWCAAVLFAYLTNRRWVFYSTARGQSELLKELGSFFACRLATGVLDWACMYVFVDLLFINDMLIKILANILVIILNYIASKKVIFKK